MKTIFALLITVFFMTSISFAGQNTAGGEAQKTDTGRTQSEQLLALSYEHTLPTEQLKATFPRVPDEETMPTNAREQYALGMSYFEGKKKPLNCMAAARCFEMAAKQGMPEAQYQLGLLYEKGKGVPQDYSRAAYWYKLAARKDFVPAQNALGFLYYNGKGVPRDLVISLALFNIAAAAGNADAFQNTYIAASTMSFKSFDKAKALSRNRKLLYKMLEG